DTHAPTGDPPPEVPDGMLLQAVVPRLHRVVDEETSDHLIRRHHAEKLCVIAEFQRVIGRWRGGAGQLEAVVAECLKDEAFGFARVRLEDAAFIQYHRAESRQV